MEWNLEQLSAADDVLRVLAVGNRMSARYGLTLTADQAEFLAVERAEALKVSGRVEFGEGILKELIRVFCDAPDLTQLCYAAVLGELQTLFYQLKTESADRISDQELLQALRQWYDRSGGDLERTADLGVEACRRVREGGRLWEEARRDGTV